MYNNLIYDNDGYVVAEIHTIGTKEVVYYPSCPYKKQNTSENKPRITKIIKDSSVFEE
jgi:hypothetical protein